MNKDENIVNTQGKTETLNIELEIAESPDGLSERAPANDFLIVGIGASAGGFEAIQIFLKKMPAETGMAFIFVPHLDPTRETMMPELLSHITDIPIRLVEDQTKVEPNNVYVISPNKTLTIEGNILRQTVPTETRGLRLPVDAFFKSLGENQKQNAVAVILSGTGADGTVGIKIIKENGGAVFAQDLESAKYDGMPQSAILTGLVDCVLPVEEIPERLVEYNKNREILQSNIKHNNFHDELLSFLDEICLLLRRKTGHDFSNYKKNTLIRRIQRQMQIEQIVSVEKYVELLRNEQQKVTDLFKDLLIGVTYFFRNREAFNSLNQTVISKIIDSKVGRESVGIRIWVPACATGEEAYTVAMLICDYFDKNNVKIPVQIFATDIDEDSLNTARAARYPESIAEQVPPEFLEKFFTQQGNTYCVKKHIREMCLFSPHNLIKDPPFSRLDLISCRNLLIYLDSDLQKRILPMFHYSLLPEGFLFLGSSESFGVYSDLFRVLDKSHRIFQAKITPVTSRVTFPLADSTRYDRTFLRMRQAIENSPTEIGKIVENIVLKNYAPTCVIVNDRGDATYFFGRTGKYFEPSSGLPSNNILDMARRGLRLDLRTALHKASATNSEITHENIAVETENQIQKVKLTVRPLDEFSDDSNLYLVVLEDIGESIGAKEAKAAGLDYHSSEDPLVQQLETELRETKEHLQTTIEELETSNEEMKSSNEELLSMNEEMQSSNEELQTSKEEMQSINEELETVNAELRKKIEELDAANSDLQNLFQSTNVATIFLDNNLRIKRFTPATNEIFRLIETDVGRPITDISGLFDTAGLASEIQMVLDTLNTFEREVQLTNQSYYTMRINPYRTLDNVINGVVITFNNISEIREAKNHAEERAKQQAAIAELGIFSLQTSDVSAICEKATKLAQDVLKTDYTKILEILPNGEELLLVSGVGWHEGLVGVATVGSGLDSQPGYTLMKNSFVILEDLHTETRFHGSNLLVDHGVISGITVVIYGSGKPYGVFGVYTNTPRQFTYREADFLQSVANIVAAAIQREENISALRESENRFRIMAETVPNLIFTIDSEGKCDFINQGFAEFLGINEPVMREMLSKAVHPADLEPTRAAWDAAEKRKEAFEHNYRMRGTDGEYRWFIGRAEPILDDAGNIFKWFGSLTDIEDILQAQKEVEEADRRKNEFLAMLGHELRNPLAPIVNSIRILKTDKNPERIAGTLEVIERQVGQMTRLVDDLLDVSRISHGKIQLRKAKTNLNLVVENLKNDFQRTVENNSLNFEAVIPNEPIWVEADEIRLTQAIGNLIGNAVKFSKAGGTISVLLGTENENAVIKVKDDGIGMSEEVLDRIFESFSQEDRSLDRSRGGLGLGLPVAKGLVELHNGTISAHSDGEEYGAEFTVMIPLVDAPIEAEAAETAETDEETIQRRILIIEDNADSAESLKFLLALDDHEVLVAHDGHKGLEKAHEFLPEIIICDIGLPGGLDGYQVAEQIRQNENLKNVFLIALSGYGQSDDLEHSQTVGFNQHLTKPADFDVLLKLIKDFDKS